MAAEVTPGPPREHVSDPLSVLHSTCAQRGWPLEVESIGLGRGGNAMPMTSIPAPTSAVPCRRRRRRRRRRCRRATAARAYLYFCP